MFKKSPPKRPAFTMNNYFLALFLFAAFYRFFGISIKMTSIISIMLSIIKYIRIFITMVTPEKKMSIEFLRGNILKVNYNADIFDSDDESEDLGEIKEQKASDQNPNISSNGIKEDGYFLLKYGDEKKKWTKVEAVTNVSFQRGPIVIEELETTSEPKEIPKREEIHIEEKPKPIIVDVDIELQTDIADVAGEPEIEEISETIKSENIEIPKPEPEAVKLEIKKDKSRYNVGGRNPSRNTSEQIRPELKRSRGTENKYNIETYKNYEKEDVTKLIKKISGPSRDFFGFEITPNSIGKQYYCLIFHYPRNKIKIFLAKDVLDL